MGVESKARDDRDMDIQKCAMFCRNFENAVVAAFCRAAFSTISMRTWHIVSFIITSKDTIGTSFLCPLVKDKPSPVFLIDLDAC